EYRRSNGANAHDALAAYEAGASGKGVKLAILDTGINAKLAEFAGRIDPASRDVAANRGVVDNEGHGTAVAGVAAAARNGSQILGVAFEATILSLNTSNPNDCGGDDGCTHSDTAIARAVDIARNSGAKIINISLGGDGVGASVLAAIERATQAGIVIVVSAGNESAADPDSFALNISQQSGNGLVIIAGAMESSRALASFSNKAGSGAAYYLTALGADVRTFDQNGTPFLYSGTSFSAPVISGAAALLASAFPNLTGAQIVNLLLTTADDAGAAGRDAVYGNGILNIERAFAPQGQTTLAGTSTPVSTDDNGTASGPMGQVTQAMAGAIILDGYSRAYALDLARTIARAPKERPLGQALSGDLHTASGAMGRTAVSITVNRRPGGGSFAESSQMGLSYRDGRKAKLVAGLALSRVSRTTAAAFGFSVSGKALQQRLAGHQANAFLVARDPMSRAGFDSDGSAGIGIRHDLGPVAMTVTSERGKVHDPRPARGFDEPGYAIDAIAFDRRLGRVNLTLGASRLAEDMTLLGGRFSETFWTGGATSHFLDGSAAFDLGGGWGTSASYRRGWTRVSGSGALVGGGALASEAFAMDLSKRGAFVGGDRLELRLMQPLRILSGGLRMSLPTSYDYATRTAGFESRLLSLAPGGREIDLEAAYTVALFGGSLSLNSYLRRQPGNIADAGDDVGGAIRFALRF
ncbi:MAG TPA: S8 family peptidase, partial [Allosphingosinicella sp.]|nr:S8 family peptidase [Allosphingosinicella sp.]